MNGASGFKLIIGILVIILCALLWIPLGYVFGEVGVALNSMTTDAGTIERNNILMQAFYYTLAIIIIGIVIYIIKPDKGEQEVGGVVYVPTY
jgi:hypothetical protein